MKYDKAIEWATALRSGKYEQGEGRLTTIRDLKEKDCCLGVACKVAIESGINIEITKKSSGWDSDGPTYRVEYNGEGCTLASDLLKDVREYLGIKSASGKIETRLWDQELEFELTVLNDSDFDFNQIADVIEFFWEEL